MDFENKKYTVFAMGQKFEVHVSRIIASWNNEADTSAAKSSQFEDWLETLGLNEVDRKEIFQFAFNGKLELEASVAKFLGK